MKIEKKLENGNKIVLGIDQHYCTDIVSIEKGYYENGTLKKSINFCIWDDMSFSGNIENTKNRTELTFEFDIDDPLYFCLNRILNKFNPLIIEDDNSYKKMKKYMEIKKEENYIKIIFKNTSLEYKEYDKFDIFIKNIFEDNRSKITSPELKETLRNFFKEVQTVLTEEYHQITIDEYIEKLNHQKRKSLCIK